MTEAQSASAGARVGNLSPTSRFGCGILFASILRLAQPPRTSAEDRVDYRFESYQEHNDRMSIETHAASVEAEFLSRITARGLFVYDTISGATPTGELPATGSDQVPLVELEDTRKALSIEASVRYDRHTTTPQYSYSEESDYRSHGISLNHAVDLNEKNTTLILGAAHNFDSLTGGVLNTWESKDTTDFLLGLSQILGPNTVVSANLTFGYADGYLADPYRRTSFILSESPDPIFSDPSQSIPQAETRPGHRFKQIGYLSLTQAIESLHGSVEAAYRPYHDDWGIWSHTLSLTWFQKLGSKVTLAPTFRYYYQTAAYFYTPAVQAVAFQEYADGTRIAFEDGVFLAFEGDPAFPAPSEESAYRILDVAARPEYYSSDFRLAELEAFTFGISAHIHLCDHFNLDLAYKHYAMHGLDGITSDSMFPTADVYTVGFGVPF